MLKNPQVRFEGQASKEYLFPKYPGKFFIQTQKLRQLKAIKNYLPLKQTNIIRANPFDREDYKQMKAEADYIKRIQDLKRKLEKQIKKYNQQKKQNEDFVKNVSISLDHKSSMIKLQQICVNIRRQHSHDFSNPQYQQNKVLDRRQPSKDRDSVKNHFVNGLLYKRRQKTEGGQIVHHHIQKDYQHFTNRTLRKSQRINKSSFNRLVPIQRTHKAYTQEKQTSSNTKYRSQNVSKINHSFSYKAKQCSHDKISIQLNPIINQCTALRNYSPRYESQKRSEKRFQFNHSQKVIGKAERKLKYLESGSKQKEAEPFLKGWDFPQDKNFQENDQIYHRLQFN